MNFPKRAFNHQRVRFSAVGESGSIVRECFLFKGARSMGIPALVVVGWRALEMTRPPDEPGNGLP